MYLDMLNLKSIICILFKTACAIHVNSARSTINDMQKKWIVLPKNKLYLIYWKHILEFITLYKLYLGCCPGIASIMLIHMQYI